jgi:hypothetical protein
MESEGGTHDSRTVRGDSPIGRWLTLNRDGSYVHVFVSPRGMVSKGPEPLLGAHVRHLLEQDAEDQIGVHAHGHTPFGHDAHPQYRASRGAVVPQRSHEEAVRGLIKALEQAPIAPWVRVERQRLLQGARIGVRNGDTTLELRTNGMVPVGRLAVIREHLARLPTVYRALWRASGFPIEIVGQRATPLPDLIERERNAGVPGVFDPRTEHVYILPAALGRTDAYAAATALEEVAHGLDVLLGQVVGLEGQAEVPLPSAAVYRSAQADVAALYGRYKATAALPPYYRSSRRELFAYGVFSYYLGDATLLRKAAGLFRFMAALEREVAAHVAQEALAAPADHH